MCLAGAQVLAHCVLPPSCASAGGWRQGWELGTDARHSKCGSAGIPKASLSHWAQCPQEAQWADEPRPPESPSADHHWDWQHGPLLPYIACYLESCSHSCAPLQANSRLHMNTSWSSDCFFTPNPAPCYYTWTAVEEIEEPGPPNPALAPKGFGFSPGPALVNVAVN